MPIDPSIALQVKPVELPDQLNSLARVMQIQGLQSTNALNQYNINKAQRTDDETNRLAQHIASGADISTPEGQAKLYSVAPTQAGAYIKNLMEGRKLSGEIDMNAAHAGSFKSEAAKNDYETRIKKADRAITDISSFNSPQEAMADMQRKLASGELDQAKYQQLTQTMPQDPALFPKWQLGLVKGIMSAKDRMALETPDANAKLTAQTSTANTAANNATSRANNAANIAKDLQVAGMAPGGGMDENSERTAQAIASGQLPAPTGMALLNPKNQRLLGRVMEINPEYDSTTVDAKKKAARDFSSGQQGNSMRSFAVAGDHLDQLGKLVDALGNGNMQLVNKIGNTYSQQTGSPNVTNFEAAKDVVSKEVIKAIVGGGSGGVEERKELAELMKNAQSPAQLKGVITQYRNLMAAQHEALLQQRRAAGIPDSTLPKYTGGSGEAAAGGGAAPTVPADIAAILAKHGGK